MCSILQLKITFSATLFWILYPLTSSLFSFLPFSTRKTSLVTPVCILCPLNQSTKKNSNEQQLGQYWRWNMPKSVLIIPPPPTKTGFTSWSPLFSWLSSFSLSLSVCEEVGIFVSFLCESPSLYAPFVAPSSRFHSLCQDLDRFNCAFFPDIQVHLHSSGESPKELLPWWWW